MVTIPIEHPLVEYYFWNGQNIMYKYIHVLSPLEWKEEYPNGEMPNRPKKNIQMGVLFLFY